MAGVWEPPPLEPIMLEAVELVTVRLPLLRPVRTALGERRHRDVLLVHVLAADAEGWADCVAEVEPTYSPEFTAGAALVLRDHLLPRLEARADALTAGQRLDAAVRGHPMARAALELALLDAQLRAADQGLAAWLGATATSVPAGATVGMHDDPDALLGEVAAAVSAGAARVRLKVAPGRAEAVAAVRGVHPPDSLALQIDANGSFDPADAAHRTELIELDKLELTCIEQPFPPDDLVAHADLARRLDTPVCLDESITSLGSFETAVSMGACEVLCLKAGRVGGWPAARRIQERAVALGLPVWVGGMFETGLGRAANLALAAVPGMTLPGDFDPRGWFATDLVEPASARAPGMVDIPTGHGTGAVPDPDVFTDSAIERVQAWPR
jgi:O-succinylbenzoate synthase